MSDITPRDVERTVLKDSEDTGLGCLSVLLVIPLAMLRGFVFAKLWLWFVVPFGVVVIPAGRMMGLFAILGMLQSQFIKLDDINKKRAGKDLLNAQVVLAMYWLIVLLIGRIGLWMAA